MHRFLQFFFRSVKKMIGIFIARPNRAPCFTMMIFAAYVSNGCAGASEERTTFQRKMKPFADRAVVGDFVLKDIDGRSHALSDYLGQKTIVISFFAMWCEPCKQELSKLDALYRSHKAKGLLVLAISMDEPQSRGEVRSFMKRRDISFPVLLDTESSVTERFNPRKSAPFNLIINLAGDIVWSHEGYVPGDELKMEQEVEKVIDDAKT
jgi:peroxiredoxin